MAKNKKTVLDLGQAKMKRSAFRKEGFIGQLYDARAEKLCSKFLFFNGPLPEKFLQTRRNNYKPEILCCYQEQLSDRFNLLHIEPELQLYILLGVVPLEGHRLYLKQEKLTERQVSSSLLYNVSTVSEKWNAAFSDIEQIIDKTAYENDEYTHVIVEMNWGVNYILSLFHSTDSERRKEHEDILKMEIKKLATILSRNKSKVSDDENFRTTEFEIYGDVMPENSVPKKMNELQGFFSKIPEFLKNYNGGKGVQLSYVMIPISTFKQMSHYSSAIGRAVTPVDESFIIELVCFFEDLVILKQKLNDLEMDYSKYQQYLPSNDLSKIQKMKLSLERNENVFKTQLAKFLSDVRADKLPMRDYIGKVERYKSTGLNLARLEDFMKRYDWVKSKLNFVDFCLSKKVVPLVKDENLDGVMKNFPHDDFYVLAISKKLQNLEGYEKNLNYFMSEAECRKINEKYIMIDLDVNPESGFDEDIRIRRFKSGRMISDDVYKEYEAQGAVNTAKLEHSCTFQSCRERPFNRVILELPCPGFRLKTCSENPVVWNCSVCKDYLEYGFDNFLYCGCGKAAIELFEFRCSGAHHGMKYLSVKNNFSFVKDKLKNLKPLKEMNILILGQSGVGKSTWINSIVNYLQYDTLDEAVKGGVVPVIPASFTVTYTKEKIVRQVVEVGDGDSNEIVKTGKSATQDPKTYNFILRDRAVRLIDTPGLGDTGGIDCDKENMKKVLDHISYLKEIHGICILLKANETRIDVVFRFCIVELLTHLHKSAARNIIFCFTKSRGSFYSPGDTSITLDQLLKELKLDDVIPLCEKTMFCLDNEAFRFLCTLKYPDIPKTREDHQIYDGSWSKSVNETKRLFEQIKTLEPHIVTETTTLCKARTRILNLTKPIAEITQTIQMNLAAIGEIEKKLRNSNLSLDELSKTLYIPNIELQLEPIDHPRTVCTNSNCVKYHKLRNCDKYMIEYVQICHNCCFLKGIITDCYPQSTLRNCWAMANGKSLNCIQCGCSWMYHMHITYKQNHVEGTVVDHDVQRKINDEKSSKGRIEAFKRELEQRVKTYENEQRTILQVCLQFGRFLKENAIAPYNDGFKDYLNYLIEQERNKVQRTQTDDDLLKNLKKMMERYEEEVKILEESMKIEDGKGISKKLTPEEMVKLERKLYDLKLTGDQIRKSAELSLSSMTQAQKRAEQALPIKNKSGLFFSLASQAKSGWNKMVNSVSQF